MKRFIAFALVLNASLLVLVVQFGLSFVQMYLMNWTGQKIMFDLRMEIFSHVQRLHMKYFDQNPVGRLITRMTTDVDVLNELFTAGVVSIFGDIFSLGGIVLVMLAESIFPPIPSELIIPFAGFAAASHEIECP